MDVGDIIKDRYELTHYLGGGGMGTVWEGRELDGTERVAIKFLHPELISDRRSLTRFFREAIAAHEARRSRNIVKMLETDQLEDGTPFLVMEFLDGISLLRVLRHEAPLAPFRVADLIIQICDGLAEVHASGVIHRDLKPANIIVCRDGQGHELIKILDFGVAKFRVSPDHLTRNLTTAGGVSGTPYYVAPERFEDDGHVDHRSDIYALGVILYEALTGKLPFHASLLHTLLEDILKGALTPPREVRPEIPQGLDIVTMRTLAREPDARYQAVDDVSNALRPYSTEGIFLSHTYEI